MRSIVKKVDEAIEANDAAGAQKLLKQAESVLDRAHSKGVVKRRTSSRTVSRLARRVAAVSGKG